MSVRVFCHHRRLVRLAAGTRRRREDALVAAFASGPSGRGARAEAALDAAAAITGAANFEQLVDCIAAGTATTVFDGGQSEWAAVLAEAVLVELRRRGSLRRPETRGFTLMGRGMTVEPRLTGRRLRGQIPMAWTVLAVARLPGLTETGLAKRLAAATTASWALERRRRHRKLHFLLGFERPSDAALFKLSAPDAKEMRPCADAVPSARPRAGEPR